MIRKFSKITIFGTMALLPFACLAAEEEPIRLVPFYQVEMSDAVWSNKSTLLQQKTLPHAMKETQVAVNRLRLTAEWLESGGTTPKPSVHRFNDSDLYKVMEGAALMLKADPNPEIEAELDRIIAIISRAQQEDGYLYMNHIVGNPEVARMGARPYSHVIHSHELYNMGHLYEAAVAYAQATGKTALLEVAEKNAKHVNRVFFEGDPNYNDGKPVMQAPGHQGIEIGLVKLYLHTSNELYLNMSKRFLEIRGVTFVPDGKRHPKNYGQQHMPVVEQREAVGHAVRATYQYAAMAEVDSLLGTSTYSEALDSIWRDIVDRKMHISGGLGAVAGVEGFGPAYVLPNRTAYLETCAAVGNVFFNMRMFLKYRDAKYVDVAEVALLNNALSGLGLDGESFFYPNPLEAYPGHRPRSKWFGTACCPANVARLVPQVPAYMYAQEGSSVYCLLYAASSTKLEVDGVTINLSQKTEYPYEGKIRFEVDPEKAKRFKLYLRIPTWTGEQFVPGKLYSYTSPSKGWSLRVNGKRVRADVENGFAIVDRKWKPGDLAELDLPMPVKANVSYHKVEANRDRISFTRGPLLFAAEGVDNSGPVQRLVVDTESSLSNVEMERFGEGLLAGLPRLELDARELKVDGSLEEARIAMIPYFAWSNRGRGSMITWLPKDRSLARNDLVAFTMNKFAGVKASFSHSGSGVDALRGNLTPKSSRDRSVPRWASWPQLGKTQWIEVDLGEEKEIASIGTYWYDDGRGVMLPGSWHVETLEDGDWKRMEIYNTDEYSTLPDTYNTVQPAERLKTDRFRLVITPQHEKTSVGMLSIDVETR